MAEPYKNGFVENREIKLFLEEVGYFALFGWFTGVVFRLVLFPFLPFVQFIWGKVCL